MPVMTSDAGLITVEPDPRGSRSPSTEALAVAEAIGLAISVLSEPTSSKALRDHAHTQLATALDDLIASHPAEPLKHMPA